MIDYTDLGDLPGSDPVTGDPVPEVLHYVRDALGSVVGLTSLGDRAANPPVPGTLVERYDYDPYGRTYIEHWDPYGTGGDAQNRRVRKQVETYQSGTWSSQRISSTSGRAGSYNRISLMAG
jgi:hypothetical protein